MTLRVDPEGLAAASAAVEALTARLAAAHGAAEAAIAAVIPSAADPVSLQTSAGFGARAAQHAEVATEGLAQLARSGIGVAESGLSYAAGDTQAAGLY